MAVIKLVGPVSASTGSFAIFTVALEGPLAASSFIDITLDSLGGSAVEGTDFAKLQVADLKAAVPEKISLSNFSTDPLTGAVSARVTNIGTTTLQLGTTLLSFALATPETATRGTNYSVSLSSPGNVISGAATVTTTIETISSRVINWGTSVRNRTIDTTTGTFLVPELDSERFARGVSASSIVQGGRYQIQTVGNTVWTTLGAADNNIGTIFTATSNGAGTGRAGLFLPNNLAGTNDFGLGFNFTIAPTTADPVTGAVSLGNGTFVLDNNGLKISSGRTAYTPPIITTTAGRFETGGKYTIASVGGTNFTLIGAPDNNIGTTFTATNNGSNNGSGTATSDGSDYLSAIGYPPGILTSGIYINALDLTTLRLGNGNDVFSVIGEGITQAVRADVSIDSSFGYIFQSSIFAGSGDDTLSVLMPWQSIFKGGTNTAYYDAIFGTNPGNGIGVTLSNALTLEEVPYGDLIELKGSRFDWDIEFKDGNGDGSVTLDSILDERDYIAVANNNQISGLERIQFGDILFDLVLYRQQQSSVVFGQPEYYLNGLENLAPELNSDIASGSKLWEAFRFNRTKLQGITGTATDQTVVFTGDTNDTPFIVGSLRFGSFNTEEGSDIVEIGSVDQASVDLGAGTDQLKVSNSVTLSTIDGGTESDNIIFKTIGNSTVRGGVGDDVIQVTTSASQTQFDGGGGSGDVLLLPGTFASYGLTSSTSGGTTTFNDGFGNIIVGFESIRFSDINLSPLQQLSLTQAATPVNEGTTASYSIALNGSGLASGQSVAFSLQLINGDAQYLSDLTAINASSLLASAGIVLSNIAIDTTAGLINAVATTSRAFSAGSTIATLAIPIKEDLLAESAETYSVTLRDFTQSQTVTTTINDVSPVSITLTGSALATEGQIAAYTVALNGVGLAVGRSVTFTVDSGSGTATEGADFSALLESNLVPSTGITLSARSTDPASKAVTVTATNISASALPVGAPLLNFELPISVDSVVEGSEAFSITLASATSLVGNGLVTTTINDLVPVPTVGLTGQPTVQEGQAAAYAVSLLAGGLLAGQSVTLTLDSTSGTATEVLDFAALVSASIKASAGITLSGLNTDPLTGALTLSATNSGGRTFSVGSQILSFSIDATADAIIEGDETFGVTLTSNTATVSAGSLTTTIKDDNASTTAIKLSAASPLVSEGRSSTYSVTLDNQVLAVGGSVTFNLDTASGSATEGVDFAALSAASLSSPAGVTLSNRRTDPVTGAVTVTATNTGNRDLAAGAQLLSFTVTTIVDANVELSETYDVTLSSGSANVSAGALIRMVITDAPASSPQDPGTFVPIKQIGNLELGTNLLGYALRNGNNSPVQISIFGVNASPAFPGAGWSAVSAVVNGSGFDLYLKNTNGSYALWNLNSTGALTTGKFLPLSDVLASEAQLGADLDGDNSIGLTFTATRTTGSVTLGTTPLGYAIKAGASNPIQITYLGLNASSSSPGAGWSAVSALANGSGFDLYLKNTDGSFAVWNLNSSGALTTGRFLSLREVLASESQLGADLNGDNAIGLTFTPTRTIGSVALGDTPLGYAVKSGTGNPIQVTYLGLDASPSFPGAGWRAVAAAANGSGFDLYLKNTNGSYALWNLNSTGALTTGKFLSLREVLASETQLGSDLDGDNTIGLTFTPTRTVGSVALGNTQLGYGIKVGTANPLPITYFGLDASPNVPGAGWSAIAAAANGSEFSLYLKNINGSYALWNLNSTGALTTGRFLSLREVLGEEITIRADLSGEGQIGPFALRGGSPQTDVLTGLANSATFGFGGADSLTSASPSTSGFDILIGGSGNDSYTLPSGRSTLIADFGGDTADSFAAPGLSLNGANTRFARLEGGRHLVISDSTSNTRVYFYDWQSSGNAIESFQLSDGTFNNQQIQQKLTSLGASVNDSSWANWDTQFGNNQLTNVGFGTGTSVDRLISFYRAVDTSGALP